MSADNTVVLLKTRNEFRVAEVQGWLPCADEPLSWQRKLLVTHFGPSRVYKNATEAMRAALTLGDQIRAERTLEYGVQLVELGWAFPR